MKLHTKILVGMLLGLMAGVVANLTLAQSSAATQLEWVINNITEPIGQVFLRLLFAIVIPLVFASLALGVSSLGGSGRLGRIGIHTFGYFLVLTLLATVIGLILIQVVAPGKSFDPETQAALLAKYGGSEVGTNTISDVVGRSEKIALTPMGFLDMVLPRNILKGVVEMQMLPTILLSILFGITLTGMKEENAASLRRGLKGLEEFAIRIVDMAMRLAPYAVLCLVFGVSARFGLEILKPLGMFVGLVFFGYVVHLFGVYSVIMALCRVNPWTFFFRVRAVLITAFSTSSSSATLPTTIRVTEQELGISPRIAGFVLPLGATANMNGTALYEGMTVLFIAQIFGIELTLMQQAIVILMAVITAVGTAGIPGASLPMIVLVMQSVGVPAEGIGIILGVDRILDMGRTVLNCTGDITAAVYVARVEGEPVLANNKKPPADASPAE